MAFERISANLERLNKNIQSFSKSSAEYYKLDLFKKVMKGATTLVNVLVIGFLSFFFLLFLSIAASIWLSNLIGIPSVGFFIVAGFYLLLILLMKFVISSVVRKKMLMSVSRKFFNDSDEKE